MAAVVKQHAVLDEKPSILATRAPSKPPLPPAKLTLEQAEKLVDGRSFELIEGRIVLKGGDAQHSDAQALLCCEVFEYFQSNPIGRLLMEFTHRLWPENPYEARTPDLSIILNEHLNEIERYATRAPDIAIEIVSRDDGWSALFEKAELYLEKGSRVVWIVDPYQKAVVVVTPNDRRWVKDTLTCPEILPGFSINVQDIFSWPTASTKTTK
jgi:Uma2 family endonuclease